MTDPFWRIEEGDCRGVMRAMEPASVQTVVTSPPYWGLRDYGHTDQLGQEATPQEYVANIVDVFREVRRILREDGTVWLNLGDSYANPGHYKGNPGDVGNIGKPQVADQEEAKAYKKASSADFAAAGLKNKDLAGIPWRVAFALQEDGWYLRSEIIWSKPNPMPESITDRPTKSHEQIFLLTKNERYFYDAHAIREQDVGGHSSGNGFSGRQGGSERVGLLSGGEGTKEEWKPGGGRNRRAVWEVPEEAWAAFAAWLEAQPQERRDVWGVATVPFKDAHFATFPPKLVLPCIQAGTPEAGVCVECGAPRKRIVLKERKFDGEDAVEGGWDLDDGGRIAANGVGHWRFETTSTTLGWRPTCTCGAPEGMEPADLDLIATPTGSGSKPDPSVEVGRAGYSRPRNQGEGTRTITRFQQRAYAAQLRERGREAMGLAVAEITDDAWAHYVRTDASGARPLPPELLERLLDEGALDPVEPPEWEPPGTRPAVVFDPFSGAGTTGVAALREGRSFVGAELSEKYAALARDRIRDDAPLFNVHVEA